MLKPSSILTLLLCVASTPTLEAMCSRQNQQNQNDDSQPRRFGSDVWYGPGFYYGVWFNHENDYWQWRGNHQDYPANHNYYHPNRPVNYDAADHGGEGRSGGRGGHGGSGGHGGGGGGHGGGGGGR